MIKLLRFLITGTWYEGHEHKWKIKDEYRKDIYWNKTEGEAPMGYSHAYVQECEICGKLKTFRVRG